MAAGGSGGGGHVPGELTRNEMLHYSLRDPEYPEIPKPRHPEDYESDTWVSEQYILLDTGNGPLSLGFWVRTQGRNYDQDQVMSVDIDVGHMSGGKFRVQNSVRYEDPYSSSSMVMQILNHDITDIVSSVSHGRFVVLHVVVAFSVPKKMTLDVCTPMGASVVDWNLSCNEYVRLYSTSVSSRSTYYSMDNLKTVHILDYNQAGTVALSALYGLRSVLCDDGRVFFNGASNAFSSDSKLIAVLGLTISGMMEETFLNCSSLYVLDIHAPSGVTSMKSTFNGCSSIASLPDINMSEASTLESAFEGCTNLSGRISIDAGNAKTVARMFYGCEKLLTQLIDEIKIPKATNAAHMFDGCAELTAIPGIDMSGLTDMTYMFANCKKLQLSGDLNISSAADMSYMFNAYGAIGQNDSISIYLPHAKNVTRMFYNSRGLGRVLGVTIDEAASASYMFGSCTFLREIVDIKIGGAASLNYFADGCTLLEHVGNISAISAVSASYMFKGCTSLVSVGDIDMDSVGSANGMFGEDSKLQHTGRVFVPSATNLNAMFRVCTVLEYTNVIATDGTCTDTGYAFQNCGKLTRYGDIDTSAVTSMPYMFSGCASIERVTLDLSSVPMTSTSSSGVFYRPLYGNTSLKELDIINVGDSLTTTSTQYLSNISIAGTAAAHGKLERMTLTSHRTNWPGSAFSIAYNNFSEPALRELFESLPTVTGTAKAITITGNPGADGIHQGTIDIATSKNWSITGATNIQPGNLDDVEYAKWLYEFNTPDYGVDIQPLEDGTKAIAVFTKPAEADPDGMSILAKHTTATAAIAMWERNDLVEGERQSDTGYKQLSAATDYLPVPFSDANWSAASVHIKTAQTTADRIKAYVSGAVEVRGADDTDYMGAAGLQRLMVTASSRDAGEQILDDIEAGKFPTLREWLICTDDEVISLHVGDTDIPDVHAEAIAYASTPSVVIKASPGCVMTDGNVYGETVALPAGSDRGLWKEVSVEVATAAAMKGDSTNE